MLFIRLLFQKLEFPRKLIEKDIAVRSFHRMKCEFKNHRW